MHVNELITWARENRQGKTEGDIRDPALLADLLRTILADHLEATEPKAEPDRSAIGRNGWLTIKGALPTARTPADCDSTAQALATLVGYLEESAITA
jgi:hypothetical protein